MIFYNIYITDFKIGAIRPSKSKIVGHIEVCDQNDHVQIRFFLITI